MVVAVVAVGMAHAEILRLFEAPYGDRRQELVLIGTGMNRMELTEALALCLLTDEEMALGPKGWNSLPDPFSQWQMVQEDGEEIGHVGVGGN